MKEKARRDMQQKMKEDSEAIREKLSIVGESNKKNDEEQGKMWTPLHLPTEVEFEGKVRRIRLTWSI